MQVELFRILLANEQRKLRKRSIIKLDKAKTTRRNQNDMAFLGLDLVGGNDARAKIAGLRIQHVIYQARFHKYPT